MSHEWPYVIKYKDEKKFCCINYFDIILEIPFKSEKPDLKTIISNCRSQINSLSYSGFSIEKCYTIKLKPNFLDLTITKTLAFLLRDGDRCLGSSVFISPTAEDGAKLDRLVSLGLNEYRREDIVKIHEAIILLEPYYLLYLSKIAVKEHMNKAFSGESL
jgi:hypothetical protein